MNIISKKVKLIWKNPYVTNGLVAMWDGTWNAPGHYHKPNITRLYECINGAYEENVATKFTSGPDYLEVADSNGVGSTTALTTAFANAVANGFARLEMVVHANAPATQIYGNVFSMLGGSFGYNPRSGTCGIRLHMRSWLLFDDRTIIGKPAVFLSIEADARNQELTYHVNQNEKTGAFSPPTPCPTTFYALNAGTRIYCARVYNRPLTDTEIEQNQISDKNRFPL